MKKILSLILACCLVSSCRRGSQEPLLKNGIENPESPVENPKKADKPESKTGMVVLGVILAVSVLVNVGLGWMLWKLWKKPPPLKSEPEVEKLPKPELAVENLPTFSIGSAASVTEFVTDQEFNGAWKVIGGTCPREGDIIWRTCQEQIILAQQRSKRFADILVDHGLAEEAGISVATRQSTDEGEGSLKRKSEIEKFKNGNL